MKEIKIIQETTLTAFNKVIQEAVDEGFTPLAKADMYHNDTSRVYLITMIKD